MAIFFFIQAFLAETSIENYLLCMSFIGLDVIISNDIYIVVFKTFFKSYVKNWTFGFLEIGWYIAPIFTCFYLATVAAQYLRDYLSRQVFLTTNYRSLKNSSRQKSSALNLKTEYHSKNIE